VSGLCSPIAVPTLKLRPRWFPRRAKAKLLNGKGKGRTDSTPPTTPSDLLSGYDADIFNLIHESERESSVQNDARKFVLTPRTAVTIIPCTNLTIGTWRRIATQVSKHDLVAYVCELRSCLTWFIHSTGYGFKMEIPFDTIAETELVDAAPGSSLASFFLTQSPVFYLEDITASPTGGPPVRTWKRCADWTEGMQATKILRHDLVGSTMQLEYLLRKLQAAPGSDIRLRGPTYGRPELQSGLSSEQNSLSANLSLGLTSEPHSYRPPFGGGAIDDNLVSDVPKRYPFAEVPLPLSAPAETSTYGVPLGVSSHSHLSLPNNSSSSTSTTVYNPYPLSSASPSSSYPTTSLYPIEISMPRPHSHLDGYGQSPYVGQGHGYSIPASAPPSHSHFELAPTPPPPSLVPQQYQRHQTAQMQGQPSLAVSVTLPFGNGFDSNGHPSS
jgi:regulatory protein PHO2